MKILKMNESVSFEYYFNKHYNEIYRYIFKKVSNIQVAEDLAMDSFSSCWEKFDMFDSNKASFKTWLYVIVNNKLKNYYRDKKDVENFEDFDEVIGGFEDELVVAEYILQMRDVLANALNTISDVQKRIIIYKYYENKKSDEIALLVGISSGNVRVQLSRAINKLKEYFDKNNIRWEI